MLKECYSQDYWRQQPCGRCGKEMEVVQREHGVIQRLRCPEGHIERFLPDRDTPEERKAKVRITRLDGTRRTTERVVRDLVRQRVDTFAPWHEGQSERVYTLWVGTVTLKVDGVQHVVPVHAATHDSKPPDFYAGSIEL